MHRKAHKRRQGAVHNTRFFYVRPIGCFAWIAGGRTRWPSLNLDGSSLVPLALSSKLFSQARNCNAACVRLLGIDSCSLEVAFFGQ